MASENPHPATRSKVVAAALAAICSLAMSFPALAEVSSSAACAPNFAARTILGVVRDPSNDKARSVAATTLIIEWKTSLPTIMKEVSKIHGRFEQWTLDENSYLLSLTDILRTILSNNNDAIKLFRACDEPSIIKPLIWAARSETQSLRLNGTLILGNTVDNTTLCFVLHHLRDPRITTAGRANLLGVTFAVASYVYRENARAIGETLEFAQRDVGPSTPQTQKLIADIASRVNLSSNKDTFLSAEGLQDPCASYDFNQPLQ